MDRLLRTVGGEHSLSAGEEPAETMNTTPFHDPRATDLLSRVSEDVSLLRQDIGNLMSHTARHTLPAGAREIADSARNRLAAGRLYSSTQLKALRNQMSQPAAAWVGGAVVVGLIAAGLFLFCKSDCCDRVCNEADEDI
jgi:hypothetical protein